MCRHLWASVFKRSAEGSRIIQAQTAEKYLPMKLGILVGNQRKHFLSHFIFPKANKEPVKVRFIMHFLQFLYILVISTVHDVSQR